MLRKTDTETVIYLVEVLLATERMENLAEGETTTAP